MMTMTKYHGIDNSHVILKFKLFSVVLKQIRNHDGMTRLSHINMGAMHIADCVFLVRKIWHFLD